MYIVQVRDMRVLAAEHKGQGSTPSCLHDERSAAWEGAYVVL